LPDAIPTIHLVRNTFRLTSHRGPDAMKRDVEPIFTAVSAAAERSAFGTLTEKRHHYLAVITG